MGTFDVYVEGPADSSPDATRRLAGAMAARYGLPAADLLNRLDKGRFRVKGNIDRATADTYARDLEALGARVVVAASASKAHPSSPALPPTTGARPSASVLPPATEPRPASSSLPPATSSRPPPSSSLPPATVSKPAPGSALPPATSSRPPPSSSLPPAPASVDKGAAPASGLAAAFTETPQDQPLTNLGALDALSLSSLDGSDGSSAPAPSSFTPPFAPPFTPSAAATTAPSPPSVDQFAAPPSNDEFAVDLSFEVEPRPRPSVPMMPGAATSAPIPRPRLSTPAGGTSRASATTLLRDPPRWRHAAGVLLAVMLGFAPAHLVAAMREEAQYAQIDNEVVARQTAATTPEAYAALDKFRAEQIERKTSARRMIALLAIGIWVAAAGLVAFVWFRLIPWDRR